MQRPRGQFRFRDRAYGAGYTPPYPELFGREEIPDGGWTVFGDEVARCYW